MLIIYFLLHEIAYLEYLRLAQFVGSLLPEDEIPKRACLHVDVPVGVIWVPAEILY